MKKKVKSERDLFAWSADIILDDEFKKKVDGVEVAYFFSIGTFHIKGDLSVNYFDLADLPEVLRNADKIEFFAKWDTLKFRAVFKAEFV